MTTLQTFRTRALVVAALTIAAFTLSGCSLFSQITNGTQRDDDGHVVEGNEDADPFSIRVGDCLNDKGVSGTVTSAPIVPCEEPHDSEAYASIMLPDGDYPGDAEVQAQAETACIDAFADFVGVSYQESKYEVQYYLPTESSWTQRNDREVLCTILDPDGRSTGTLENAGQ